MADPDFPVHGNTASGHVDFACWPEKRGYYKFFTWFVMDNDVDIAIYPKQKRKCMARLVVNLTDANRW